MNEKNNFKSGFISLVGRPNVGKSTLVNAIVGQKVAAVSDKPNTTRNRVVGIKTYTDSQLIFLDTPGIHKAKSKLGKAMVQTSVSSINEADLVVFIIEVNDPFGKGDRYIIETLPENTILVINKIDKIKKPKLLEILNTAMKYESKLLEIVPISAIENDGVSELIELIKENLPRGHKYFPDDMYTDQSERFLISELIREKIFNITRDEIPYKTAVVIDDFKENMKKNIIKISALVYVEKESHKGIIIGKKGQTLKKVGELARNDIENILASKIFLEIWVKVKDKWTQRDTYIREFGYNV